MSLKAYQMAHQKKYGILCSSLLCMSAENLRNDEIDWRELERKCRNIKL
jgi:hypothetical protein